MAAKKDIYIEQGATFSEKLVITDDAGNPVDITSWVFLGQVRLDFTAANVLATITTVPINLSLGEILLTIPNTETATIPVGETKVTKYAWDLIETHGGKTKRLLEGVAEFSAAVSRV